MNLPFRAKFKENAEMNKIPIYNTKPKNIIDNIFPFILKINHSYISIINRGNIIY